MALKSTGNIAFSPFSIRMCLSLMLQGAEGSTFKELKRGLMLSNKRVKIAKEQKYQRDLILSSLEEPNVLTFANEVFVLNKFPIDKKFMSIAKDEYDSEIKLIDFTKAAEATLIINNSVKEKTQGKITNIVQADSLRDGTQLVLVNAVSFKGMWSPGYDDKNSKQRRFWTSKINSMETEFIIQVGCHLYGDFPDYTAVGIHYQNSKLKLLILVPKRRDGLPKLMTRLDQIDLTALKNSLVDTRLRLLIPKFKIDCKIDLKNSLSKVSSLID